MGSRYLGTQPLTKASYDVKEFIATQGQTTFNLDYNPNFLDVLVRGIQLPKSDYTATDGLTVTLNQTLTAGWVVTFKIWGTFNPVDTYSRAEATSEATADKLVMRDASGTAKFGTPTVSAHPVRIGDIQETTGDSTVFPMSQKAVTDAVGRVQEYGSATWSSSATPYPINAQVYHNAKQWLALRANSVAPFESADWTELVGKKYIDAAGYLQPTMTGTATIIGSGGNTVQLTNIVPTLGLEVGDVIRIQYTGYDKLHTVESTIYNYLIAVNREHAGDRGNGSLRLPDTTTFAIITRIAKWYNAPIGLGQAWVACPRARNTTYTNASGRLVAVSVNMQGVSYIYMYVGGHIVSANSTSDAQKTNMSAYVLVPTKSTYMAQYPLAPITWWELR